MVRIRLLFFLVFLLACQTLVAQKGKTVVRGCVRSLTNLPLQGINVYVSLKDRPYQVLASDRTDKDGLFMIGFVADADSVSLYCTCMTVKKQKMNLLNKSSFHTIYVEEKAQKLKEVIVKAPKIYSRGDTINYHVASFMSKNDQSIGDVLKRMPGIMVSEAGKISYKGMPIKNFYIEGMDLMKDRYGVATNNVDPNSISTVQVLENHQDVKALKNLRPEERASINLKLKKGVRGVFNLIGTMGGGYDGDALWTGEMLATYFKRNSQLLASYKGNNMGVDLEPELRSFDGDDYDRVYSLTSIEVPSAPGIDKRHYYFNRSHSATYNNIFRITKEENIGVNLGALTDCDHRSSLSVVDHLLPDGTYNNIHEDIAAHVDRKMMYGNFSFIDNADKHYVKDLLTFDLHSIAGKGAVMNGTSIQQRNQVSDYRLQNKLHLTGRYRQEKGIDFVSKLNVEKRPQNLWVDTNLFPDYLSSDDMSQWVEGKNFEMKNRLSALSSLVVGHLQLSPSLFFDVRHDEMKSALEEYENNLWFVKLHAGMGLSAIYRIGRFMADVYLPVGYRYQRLKDKGFKHTLNSRRMSFEPSANFSYQLSTSHSLDYRMSLSYELPSIENLYRQLVLNDYRQLSSYRAPTLYQGITLSSKLSYNYKNIFKMLFLGVDLVWIRNQPRVLYGSTYNGMIEMVESKPTNIVGRQKGIKLNVSKGFDWKKSKVALMVEWLRTDSPILLQNEECTYLSDAASVKLDAYASFFSWLAVSHVGKYDASHIRLKGGEKMPFLSSMSNDMSLDFFLPAGITLSTMLSHYYNRLNVRDKSFLLCGLSGKYTYHRWMFTLQCNNIFDKKYYTMASSSLLSERRIEYRIRSRSLMLKVRYRIF